MTGEEIVEIMELKVKLAHAMGRLSGFREVVKKTSEAHDNDLGEDGVLKMLSEMHLRLAREARVAQDEFDALAAEYGLGGGMGGNDDA